MGINGSATCVLNFGDNGTCVGELVGGVENAGMSQMFRMMNGARIAVGLQGLAVASTAYLNALEYARERKQGSNYRYWKDPTKPRVPIIDHPDVRRMLLDCKATVEGTRMLIVKGANHIQAMDLVGRKLGQAGGAHFQQFMGDIGAFLEAHRQDPIYAAEIEILGAAQEAVLQLAMGLLEWSQSDQLALIPLNANRFLTVMRSE